MSNTSQNEYLKSVSIEKGVIDGTEYLIAKSPSGHLNGYAVFPKGYIREDMYGGILSYVPVHWGITYNEQDDKCQMFGFDTAHYNSEEYPRDDPEWIKEQITMMIAGLKKAHEVERNYLRCTTNKGKAKWAQMVMDTAEQDERGMGLMINMLAGKL